MSLDKINKNQIKLLKDCKKFILKEKNKNIDICASPLCFLLFGRSHPVTIKHLIYTERNKTLKYCLQSRIYYQ